MTEERSHSLPKWPLTPPDYSDPQTTKDVSSVVTAIHVISTERAALAHLEHIYQTDARAQHDLARAVEQIARSVRDGGKLVVCGVGKSGKVGRKIEATMNSLGVYSAFLHPTEALHGDLGLVRPVSKKSCMSAICIAAQMVSAWVLGRETRRIRLLTYWHRMILFF